MYSINSEKKQKIQNKVIAEKTKKPFDMLKRALRTHRMYPNFFLSIVVVKPMHLYLVSGVII